MPEKLEKEKHQGRYMAGLDGLRALAVLAVMAYHLHFKWAPGGLLGVGVFFVLSGYLITDILASQWERDGKLNLRDFWMRRVRRLLPAMLFLVLVVVLWVLFVPGSQPSSLAGDVWASVLYINNWWLVFHHVSYFESFGPPSPLGHLWSLAVEEQFYLLWPFLVALCVKFVPSRAWRTALVLLGAVASAVAMALLYEPGVDPSRVYYGTDTRAFALLIGAALAWVWPSAKLQESLAKKARVSLDLAGGAGLLVILLMVWLTNQYQTFLYRGGFVLLSVATAMVVAMLAHPASRLANVLGAQPLRWLGVRSYGMYLWHYPIIVLTSPAVDTGGLDVWRSLLQVALTIGIAALSYEFVEKPIRYRTASYNKIVVAACTVVALGVSGGAMALPAPQIPTHAVPVTVTPEPSATTSSASPTCHGVTAMGDSVMLDAEPFLKEFLPGIVVDAQVGRQMVQLPDVVERLKSEGKLGSCVMIQTGTNGPFTQDQLVALLDSLGPDRQIVLVNTRVPRPWESVVNSTLQEVAASYPHTTLVDWYGNSAGKDSYFYPDGVHLNPEGAQVYASLLSVEVTTDKER
ncbi:acetyltransferase [Tumebacillus sp. ITR2]|uniref:Acetyltransferase n=1 Tax=Tumebacillus amylolyticus TaxID=2801339 RepID=A0ABS1J6Q4_9BACL|nr:acyltransferase family protein [Tumebacillus amylolyticus]MBL0385897.1 acetyltransferase [Tumebacillus amylolyticus]